MGWFSSSSTLKTPAPSPADEQLIEGGSFHGTAAAQKAPVRQSITKGLETPTEGGSGGTGFPTDLGAASAAGLAGGQYEYKNTLASTYFTQGDDRSKALINSASNQLHRWLGYVFGVGAYGFGSAMHVFGQGTALTTLTMSAAGTCFFLNSMNRQVNGPTKDIFWFECLGSWLWMLASFQQFSTLKKMKYAGYSSWSGLALTVYYSSRYLVALQRSDAE